jgi:hypothetical protein
MSGVGAFPVRVPAMFPGACRHPAEHSRTTVMRAHKRQVTDGFRIHIICDHMLFNIEVAGSLLEQEPEA